MNALGVAIRVEARKARAARPVLATSVLFAGGLLALAIGMTLAASSGRPELVGKLGPLADARGWELYLGVAIQVAGAAGLLATGVVLAYLVGREFGDGTIAGLFALPVPRAVILAAKVVVFLAWSLVLALAVGLAVLLGGLALGLEGQPGDVAAALVRLVALVPLSALTAVPVALAASLGRGLLPGIGLAVVLLAAAQVAVVAGAGPWFPVATGALWAIDPAAVPPLAFLPAVTLPVAAGLVSARVWSRLQLDR
ncbi:MAG: ABC transporter permease [Actinomycetales bacterium]|nr:ABC transporter permease [Actinomycetales bacterium]